MTESYAEVKYMFGSQIIVWETVIPTSPYRHNDGAMSFLYRCANDHQVRRVTIHGTYFVKYPPDPQDQKK